MTIRAKNGKWEYRFSVGGQRVTKLTDLEATEQNRIAAEKLEKKHRDSILKGERSAHRMLARPCNKAMGEFIEAAKIQYAEHPNSAKRIATSLASAREFFGTRPAASLRAIDIERYKSHRLTVHKVQPITLRHDLNNLSLFFQWAVDMQICPGNPITRKTYRGLPSEAERIHVITAAEEKLYFERAAVNQDLTDLARLMLNQGCRPEELMGLAWAHVTDTHLRIVHGKTGAAKRRLKLTAESRMILERRGATAGRWVFPSPKRPGKHLVKLNGAHDKVCSPKPTEECLKPQVLDFVLYDWRHTFATRAAQDGMDLATLARILGHSSLRMVTKYVHIQQGHMDEQMEKIEKSTAPQSTLNDQAHLRPNDDQKQAEIGGNQQQRPESVN